MRCIYEEPSVRIVDRVKQTPSKILDATVGIICNMKKSEKQQVAEGR